MDARKLSRFATCEDYLACPVCGDALSLDGTCLACSAGHRFDIARQGYVNLLRGKHNHDVYDRESFASRRTVFESGLYAPLADAVCKALEEALGELPTRTTQPLVVDAGCGEGYFSSVVRKRTQARVCAFDISRDSIQLAAVRDPEDGITWLVADIAAIPLQTGVATAVLDIFSPARYNEFHRILKPGGRVIKVVPTANHMHEVRALAAGSLQQHDYSNQRVLDHFAASCTPLARHTVSNTIALTPELRDALIAMTPLLFSVDTAAIDWSGLTHATVEAEVLVGTWNA